MNKIERIKLVKAMEFIVRNLNDEDIFMSWLYGGVADGDIEYGNLDIKTDDLDELEYYAEDETFSDLIDLFLRMMVRARNSGGLYCDGVCAGEREESEKPFGVVRWYNEDIKSGLEADGIEPTEDLIDAVRTQCERNHHFTDTMIEAGWYMIDEAIHEVRREMGEEND